MAYHVIFTALNNELNVNNLSDYGWYHYSDMSVGVVGYYFGLVLARVCVRESDSTK